MGSLTSIFKARLIHEFKLVILILYLNFVRESINKNLLNLIFLGENTIIELKL